jgi:hypothetical protein
MLAKETTAVKMVFARRRLIIAAVTLTGCVPLLNEATQPTAGKQCVAALEHVRQCDARFPDRATLCEYSGSGECAPYINAAQTQCLRESTCDAVRAALDRRDWLCGLPLSTGPDIK